EQEGAKHVYHLYVVLVNDRQDFMAHLKEKGIETGVHYPQALHQLTAFADYDFPSRSFPNAERVARHGVSLPMCPTLTAQDIDRVTDAVRSYFRLP
ncbi:MAG: DegT/DnrJ/EryC1/StrS family aminotransferase, partial [Deltaproteobacteria bacterium]|nr:DegT/DnrJ/EryC1/StrS family aminotransferase [Deltaproteobacteria bacterium]